MHRLQALCVGLPGRDPSEAPQLAQSRREGTLARAAFFPDAFFLDFLAGVLSARPPPPPPDEPPPPRIVCESIVSEAAPALSLVVFADLFFCLIYLDWHIDR